jgi:hypothetical protein
MEIKRRKTKRKLCFLSPFSLHSRSQMGPVDIQTQFDGDNEFIAVYPGSGVQKCRSSCSHDMIGASTNVFHTSSGKMTAGAYASNGSSLKLSSLYFMCVF